MESKKVEIFFKPTTKKDKEIVEDLVQYYDKIYKCECGRIYGSNMIGKDRGTCPICLTKERKVRAMI